MEVNNLTKKFLLIVHFASLLSRLAKKLYRDPPPICHGVMGEGNMSVSTIRQSHIMNTIMYQAPTTKDSVGEVS